ncbi:MAG: hypothetical protein J2P57_12590, partial [Acidimicrobiaceae bacterium]|nr:hypothetical protein [Acidimicrobiaceae bacterium]
PCHHSAAILPTPMRVRSRRREALWGGLGGVAAGLVGWGFVWLVGALLFPGPAQDLARRFIPVSVALVGVGLVMLVGLVFLRRRSAS